MIPKDLTMFLSFTCSTDYITHTQMHTITLSHTHTHTLSHTHTHSLTQTHTLVYTMWQPRSAAP